MEALRPFAEGSSETRTLCLREGMGEGVRLKLCRSWQVGVDLCICLLGKEVQVRRCDRDILNRAGR